MKNNWIFTSIVSGILGGFIAFILTKDWKLSIISSILILVVVLLNNPKRRFMKAFWIVLSMIFVLNKFFFEIIGRISDIHFKFGNNEAGNSVTIFLIILAGICLLLDYFERNGKIREHFIEMNRNTNKNVTGSNININQKINKESSKQND